MGLTIRRLLAVAIPLTAALTAARAGAVEVPNVGGKPLSIDITNTAVTAYHFNNRNDSDLKPPTQVDDDYGEVLDRLNIQATWWRLRLGVRLDTNAYFHTLDRAGVAALVKDQTPAIQAGLPPGTNPAGAIAQRTADFYNELHSRFLRAIYPQKLFIGYSQPGLEVTVGDYYVQLGRGLVFSVRKVDELAVDTTVRGVKVDFDREVGGVQFDATVFGGQLNPIRVDEASGRRLNGSGSPLFFGFPTGGALETYDITSMPGTVIDRIQPARPSYLEDSAAGGKIDVGTKWFTLGANAAGLYRTSHTADYLACMRALTAAGSDSAVTPDDVCSSRFPEFKSSDPSRQHNRILNYSASLSVPSIMKHGDLYVEVAGQSMRSGHLASDPRTFDVVGAAPDLDGYAVYASASITGGPVSISIEGKHYRNFFPLSANIDATTPGFGAPEFSLVTYSQPPTAEPIYAEVVSGGAPGVCVTGGRARVDYRFNRHASAYAWVGRYTSWSEIPGQDLGKGCTIAPTRPDPTSGRPDPVETDIWDSAAGLDFGVGKSRAHVKAWAGVRTSDTAVARTIPQADPDPITAFYREGYVRYDMIFHLGGPFSLQLQGFHRRRWEPVSFAKPWTEGENYTALQWSPHLSAIFGYEYFAKEQCQPSRLATLTQPMRAQQDFCSYVSGGLQWRAGSTWSDAPRGKYVAQLFDAVNLFVGQRRGAVRCVSGVCRQFPAFEGARLEVTSRF